MCLLATGEFNFVRDAFRLFGLVLRVRQSCCHADLIPECDRHAVEIMSKEFQDVNLECLDSQTGERFFKRMVEVLHGVKEKGDESDDDDHQAKRASFEKSALKGKEGESIQEEPKVIKRVSFENASLGRSPKVQALLNEIKVMKPDEKGVIFSQWTKVSLC